MLGDVVATLGLRQQANILKVAEHSDREELVSFNAYTIVLDYLTLGLYKTNNPLLCKPQVGRYCYIYSREFRSGTNTKDNLIQSSLIYEESKAKRGEELAADHTAPLNSFLPASSSPYLQALTACRETDELMCVFPWFAYFVGPLETVHLFQSCLAF